MLRLLGWDYVPFIEMGAGFAGGAADLLCVRAVVRVVVLCYMGTCMTPILVFLYGMYICCVYMESCARSYLSERSVMYICRVDMLC
jgi:hypothetical protein